MDDESGESMELIEKMPLKELGESVLERLVCVWRGEARSWFQRRGKAYWKERSVVHKEDDVDGRASVTKDEERVLRGGWMVMRSCRYEGYKDSTSLWPAVQACWVCGGNCSISNSERRSALQRGCKCNLQFMRRHSSSKSVHTSTACMSYMFLLNTSCKSNDLFSFSKDMHAAKLCINKIIHFLTGGAG